jgi:hypothetical protein
MPPPGGTGFLTGAPPCLVPIPAKALSPPFPGLLASPPHRPNAAVAGAEGVAAADRLRAAWFNGAAC